MHIRSKPSLINLQKEVMLNSAPFGKSGLGFTCEPTVSEDVSREHIFYDLFNIPKFPIDVKRHVHCVFSPSHISLLTARSDN